MIVVDSSALVAILKQESDAGRFARAFATQSRKLISSGTYLECAMVSSAKLGANGLAEFKGLARYLELELVPFDHVQANVGIEAFRRYGRGSGHEANLNFGDCFAYALARLRNLPLLFKGNDFIHTDIMPALTREER